MFFFFFLFCFAVSSIFWWKSPVGAKKKLPASNHTHTHISRILYSKLQTWHVLNKTCVIYSTRILLLGYKKKPFSTFWGHCWRRGSSLTLTTTLNELSEVGQNKQTSVGWFWVTRPWGWTSYWNYTCIWPCYLLTSFLQPNCTTSLSY
jgi:hypothetical protein